MGLRYMLVIVSVLALYVAAGSLVNAQDVDGSTSSEMNINYPLIVAEAVLLLITLIALPVYAIYKVGKDSGKDLPLKGLALPQGSVRSMLALTVVGSFVVFLVFGEATSQENFTEIVAALGGIAGTIMGFYFGSGGSGGKG
ncbi:MAG: hypothetical protein OXC09_00975 [Truepera sp.]|nr:hypothetical protein [Truepera sp.]